MLRKSTHSKARTVRVMHVVLCVMSGGVERRRLDLAREFDTHEFKQCIVSMGAIAPMKEAFEDAGVEVYTLGGSGFFYDVRTIFDLVQLIRQWKPDIIHGAVFEGVMLAGIAGFLTRVPCIVIEEIAWPLDRSERAEYLLRMMVWAADHCVSVSASVTEYLRGRIGVPSHKLVEITNGVSPPQVPSLEVLAMERERWGLTGEEFVVGSVGRLFNEFKRFSDLIETIALLRPHIPNLRLLLVGSGRDREALEELARERKVDDIVIFTGYRIDVGTFYGLMDVFAIASATESFGLVLVEAMFSRLPVVATKVGGMREIVVDGETGIFVSVQNPPQLAEAILKLYRNPELRQRMGDKGFQRAADRFSGERYAREVANHYRTWIQQKVR